MTTGLHADSRTINTTDTATTSRRKGGLTKPKPCLGCRTKDT
jgi:hypothetical protein